MFSSSGKIRPGLSTGPSNAATRGPAANSLSIGSSTLATIPICIFVKIKEKSQLRVLILKMSCLLNPLHVLGKRDGMPSQRKPKTLKPTRCSFKQYCIEMVVSDDLTSRVSTIATVAMSRKLAS